MSLALAIRLSFLSYMQMVTEPGHALQLHSDRADSAALQHGHWRKLSGLSSGVRRWGEGMEHFLVSAGFDRAPWLAVAFAAGIGAWLVLPQPWHWIALLALCGAVIAASLLLLAAHGYFSVLRQSLVVVSLAISLGCLTVWSKSVLVGAPAIERPMALSIKARVLDREEQPAENRVRLVLAMRAPGTGAAIRVRVNMPLSQDRHGIAKGAVLRLRARLMPPASPMLPGGYDFARAAWFSGFAATGSVTGPVEVIEPGGGDGLLGQSQSALSAHVRAHIDGSAGAIAAALASGDRGAIAPADDTAMRDAGLTHLLSVSGLHVSAMVAAAYFIALRLLALWPWLALRVRLPLVAAAAGGLAGIGYTLLTGAEVPTVRSCVGALLVLGALALGREPLSLRMLACAALIIMLLWPEAVVSPGFQMSFGSVIAIVALHSSRPVVAFMAPREEARMARFGRQLAMLVLTGLVIEITLMPIGLYHFHRAGVYGALANVIAIPLTTLVTMPLIALALALDMVGLGAPAWWLAGKSLELLLWIAHATAAQPGAVTLLPAMGLGAILLFAAGGLWLALWRGRARLLGGLPIAAGCVALSLLRPPDVLISGDGRHVGITGEAGGELLVLRDGTSSFARENLSELAGMSGAVRALADWPGAQCSRDFCALSLRRGGRTWHMLIARGREVVEERALAAACDQSDIVIADRWLPRSCQPRVLKADRNLLERTGGMALNLSDGTIRTVAQGQGAHGWWRPALPPPWRRKAGGVEPVQR